MKLLRRHLGVTVIEATLLVLLVLVGLQVFISLVAQLKDLGVGGYGIWQALEYVILTLPKGIYDFFPMAGLLGCLLGLGYLASNSELVIMRTSGVSLKQVLGAVLRAAIFLMVGAVILGELISPAASHLAKMNKTIAKSGGEAIETHYGLWMRDGNDFIRIEKLMPGKRLRGISQYQFDETGRLLTSSYAEKASKQNSHWQLENVVESHFLKDKITTQQIPKEGWSVKIKPELFSINEDEPQSLSLTKLNQLINYRALNGLNVQSLQLTFWQRIFQPFASLIMIILAVPFIFGPLRTVPMGIRVVAGVIVGAIFYLLNQFFGPLSLVYQIPPLLGALVPSLLFLLIGFLFLRKAM